MKFDKLFNNIEYKYARMMINASLIFISFIFFIIDEASDDDRLKNDDQEYLHARRLFLFLLNIALSGELLLLYKYTGDINDLNYAIHPPFSILILYLSAYFRFDAIYGKGVLEVWNIILFIIIHLQTMYTVGKKYVLHKKKNVIPDKHDKEHHFVDNTNQSSIDNDLISIELDK